MENGKLTVNRGKRVRISCCGKEFDRYAIKTHFIQMGEDILDIIGRYVVPVYQKGDILCIAEKVVAICQGNVVYKKDIKVSRLARLLARFVSKTRHGMGIGDVYAMQIAINMVGPVKIVFAAIVAGLGKLVGVKGLFYRILGPEVRGIDCCLTKESDPGVFDYYFQVATLIPTDPDGVCDRVYERYGINCAIVDANDLGVEILGLAGTIANKSDLLKQVLRDNPAGQNRQQTPLILVRPVENNKGEG